MTKKSIQKVKYLENEKIFEGEIKSIFHPFLKGFQLPKIVFDPLFHRRLKYILLNKVFNALGLNGNLKEQFYHKLFSYLLSSTFKYFMKAFMMKPKKQLGKFFLSKNCLKKSRKKIFILFCQTEKSYIHQPKVSSRISRNIYFIYYLKSQKKALLMHRVFLRQGANVYLLHSLVGEKILVYLRCIEVSAALFCYYLEDEENFRYYNFTPTAGDGKDKSAESNHFSSSQLSLQNFYLKSPIS